MTWNGSAIAPDDEDACDWRKGQEREGDVLLPASICPLRRGIEPVVLGAMWFRLRRVGIGAVI